MDRRESDVVVKRGVTAEQAQMFAQRNKMFYIEVSAKTGYNVEQAFYKMAYEVNAKTTRGSRDGSRERGAKGDSREGSQADMMQDRVKLRPSNSSAPVNQYAAANEVPMGQNETKKKKCC